LPEAIRVKDAIQVLTKKEVILERKSGGIFDVINNGKLVFSKANSRRFPSDKDISKIFQKISQSN